MPSEAGIFSFQRLSTFPPVVLLNLQKGASPESPVDCELLHWCCATCFLLKMHSRLCFYRGKKYSFFPRPPFLKIKCSGKFWAQLLWLTTPSTSEAIWRSLVHSIFYSSILKAWHSISIFLFNQTIAEQPPLFLFSSFNTLRYCSWERV